VILRMKSLPWLLVVASATADGHTLLMNSSAFAGAASIYPKLPFDTIKDFTGVSLVTGNPLVLAVAPSLGVKTMKELIALAHKHCAPQKYRNASSVVHKCINYARADGSTSAYS
jgi:tripartite-type tricarboxylate transporter receptor subunit TctC